jgi:hypothetical protein
MPPKKKSKTAPAADAASSAQPDQPPNWPVLAPLVPPSDLSLQVLLPDQIITVPSLWTATLCKNYVSFLSSLPLITTPGQPKKGVSACPDPPSTLVCSLTPLVRS